jgi:hypothetical protein
MRFKFLKAMNMKITVFWDAVPQYNLGKRFQPFEGICYFDIQSKCWRQ